MIWNGPPPIFEAVLGAKLEPMGDPTGGSRMMSFPAEMSRYGAGGALTKSSHAGPGVGGTTIYFMAENCRVQQDRIADAGGAVAWPRFFIGKIVWVVLSQDTEGSVIGFNSMN